MIAARNGPAADVCLIVEGAYPHVTGGVSSWVHDLILALADRSFHLVVLTADESPRALRYELPRNVLGMTEVPLQRFEPGVPRRRGAADLIDAIEAPLRRLLSGGGGADFREVHERVRAQPHLATREQLLNSEAAFAMLQRMYDASVPTSSFIQYFWSWRALVGGLFSVMLAPLPRAGAYHAISTGYAGLMMARAVAETGRHGLVTEHGIYTNERRIEIAMADWLTDRSGARLDIEKRRRDLRDVWMDAFTGYARACYESSSRIVTLYRGNQRMQLQDGAPRSRLAVIPNGVDVEFYGQIRRDPARRAPTVALIGRVVPIKDVKTFIRAIAELRETVPEVRALVLGPTDEDPSYFRECTDLIAYLQVGESIEFCGRVKLGDHLGRIDLVVLTSVSEAQPLVLLEAGAAGIPSVATDVGSCREILEGDPLEEPPLGAGGIITPLANPQATAKALAALLTDSERRARCAAAIQQRTQRYYSKETVWGAYDSLYRDHQAPEPDMRRIARVS